MLCGAARSVHPLEVSNHQPEIENTALDRAITTCFGDVVQAVVVGADLPAFRECFTIRLS